MDASERRDAALARPPDPTSRVPLLSPTSLGWDPERLAAHLHHHSFAIAQAPSSLASDATTDARDAARAFFARDAASKRATSRGGGSSEGYSAAEGGTHECFEVRASTSEVPSFRRLYDALEAIARACVADLETHLGIPRGSDDGLAALLDRRAAGGGDETAGDDDDDASLTAMRVLHYRRRDALTEADASSLAASGLGDHTDSSILTVAPRSSLRAGLEVAPYAPRGGGGENGSASAGWIDVEARMTDDDVIVFAGDALAAATWNYFPAALHRPRVERTREEAAAAPRVSCPFFLRPRADAALDAKALASPALASRVAGIASGATTACLAIDLERNADDVRRSWPWRSERGFYGGVVFAEEEVVVDVVDGGKVVGSVRVPNGVSPEEFIEQSRRFASGMRIGVDGVGTGGGDADAADAEEGGDGGFWTRAKRATAAGTDRKRLHHLPWSADEYVKCVALNAPAAFTADEGSDRGWRELVDHDVVTLTDMSADAAAAAAAAAAASVFDDSDDDDDDKEEEDEAGREKSGELHEIIRVDPPAVGDRILERDHLRRRRLRSRAVAVRRRRERPVRDVRFERRCRRRVVRRLADVRGDGLFARRARASRRRGVRSRRASPRARRGGRRRRDGGAEDDDGVGVVRVGEGRGALGGVESAREDVRARGAARGDADVRGVSGALGEVRGGGGVVVGV